MLKQMGLGKIGLKYADMDIVSETIKYIGENSGRTLIICALEICSTAREIKQK